MAFECIRSSLSRDFIVGSVEATNRLVVENKKTISENDEFPNEEMTSRGDDSDDGVYEWECSE